MTDRTGVLVTVAVVAVLVTVAVVALACVSATMTATQTHSPTPTHSLPVPIGYQSHEEDSTSYGTMAIQPSYEFQGDIVFVSSGVEVIRLHGDAVFWNGRPVTYDAELVAALRAVCLYHNCGPCRNCGAPR